MMKKYFIQYIAVLCMLFYFGCGGEGYGVEPTTTPVVALSASADNISVLETLDLTIDVENLEDIFGITFEIAYDPTYLAVVPESCTGLVDDNTIINATDESLLGPLTVCDDNQGIISFVKSGSNIDGTIYTVSFTGESAGEVYITLGEVYLKQSDGTDIPNYSSFTPPDPIRIVVSETE